MKKNFKKNCRILSIRVSTYIVYVCRRADDDRVLNFDNRVHFLPLCSCHRHRLVSHAHARAQTQTHAHVYMRSRFTAICHHHPD